MEPGGLSTDASNEDMEKLLEPVTTFTASSTSMTAPEGLDELATPPGTEPSSQHNQRSYTTPNASSPPGFSLAQLSFLPATKTTVVTTTTTTTVNCPPLVMKEPHNLANLDPKIYPLAASPIPAIVKKFDFELADRRMTFQEVDDPVAASRRLLRQRRDLRDLGGSLREEKSLKSDSYDNDSSQTSPSASDAMSAPSKQLGASPVIYGEAGRFHTPNPRRGLTRTISGPGRPSRLQFMQTTTPITPSLADNEEDVIRLDPQGAEAQTPPASNEEAMKPRMNLTEDIRDHESTASATEADTQADIGIRKAPSAVPQTRRPRPLNTRDATDASLPSPSLSPVTAAARPIDRRGYFDQLETLVNRSPPNELSDDTRLNESPYPQDLEVPSSLSLSREIRPAQGATEHSLMDVPTMIESFEALPQGFKNYVMFQFLRRCEKPVLQFVADHLNPALKCDFISLLPGELVEHILGLLDVKTLCRAAQVSKKWRNIIDGSEKTWKDSMHRAGYSVPQSELRRAILEGWGWQYGSNNAADDWEKDIGGYSRNEEGDATMQPSASTMEEEDVGEEEEDEANEVEAQTQRQLTQQSPSRRTSKRKTASKGKTAARKLQKRRDAANDEPATFDTNALLKQLSDANGPFNVASVASIAVQHPTDPVAGLASIQNMHLYKSLFRRQRKIDSYWMSTKSKPKHLAFKAHERHVVTCLHFDSERILTGSDDTNINVYDTRTGVQRTILKGHDGGVWALKCHGNTLVSGSTDRSVRVWDIEAGECTHVFHGHTSTVRCLVILLPTVVGRNGDGSSIISPSQPLIITGSRDSTLRIWRLPQAKHREFTEGMTNDELENFYFVRALSGHTHSVRAIAAHGDTLVSGSYDHTVRVWKVSTGEQRHILRGHTQKVYSVVLDTKRDHCISGSMDYTVKIWSLTDGSVIHNLDGHNSLVGLLDLKGDRLVSAAADSTLRIWDPESGHCKATLLAHTGAITCFQHDARKVISGSDRTLKMWDARTGEFVRDLLTDLSGVWQVGFDGRRCVAAVQRDSLTYIEILDFGAARDGVPMHKQGIRIEVDQNGEEVVRTPGLEERPELLMTLEESQTGMI